MDLKKLTYATVTLLILNASLIERTYATDVTVIGSIKHILKQSPEGSISKVPLVEKEIQLLHVELSEDAKNLLEHRALDVLTHTNQFAPQTNTLSLPNNVQLGMNKLKVLNQGQHGSCVAFAVTGAIDAIIGKGDYVSQLCQLQLGSYLEKQEQGASGWEGGVPITIIRRMEQFGIVNKDKQHAVGCGGLYHYPTRTSRDPNSFIDTAQFNELSEPVFGNVLTWSDLLLSFSSNNNPEETLTEVKQALNAGDRVVFATLLPHTELGNTGAVGKHNTWFAKDSWVVTPAILSNLRNVQSAHELIITGYDDDAIAVDGDKGQHKGLLILRNSWGKCAGYYGEFYMSYDYFKLLAYDVKRFSATKS